MGKREKKKKHDTSSENNESHSASEEDSPKYSKHKSKDYKRKRSSSRSDDEEKASKKYGERSSKSEYNKINAEKARKHRYEDVQKSKWDSPAESVSRSSDRRPEKETRRKHQDRDEGKEHYKEHDKQRTSKRDEHKYESRGDSRKYKDHRYEKRDRYDRRQSDDRKHDRHRSRSREDRRENTRHRGNRKDDDKEGNKVYEWGKRTNEESKTKPVDKEKPNFGLSGKLTEDTNTFRGVVIKYSEPPEARKPKRRWRLYPFKGEKALPTLYIHRESAYLMGRDRKIVDFPLDHPSCSKQHAVLQYRLVPFTREDGSTGKRVRPYLIDLESANGTYINNKRIEPRKYVELLEKDIIKFGYSSREYVLLHENSKDEALDDDVKQEDDEIPIKEEQE